MKVLLTGSAGYIGIVTAPALIERGHDVTGLDTGFYAGGWLYNGLRVLPRQVMKDIRQITSQDLAGYDAVVHMAELSNDPLGQLNPQITYTINHQGSVALAKAAKQAGVSRFVYMSSCSVYGIGGSDVVDEQSPLHPQTAYAECKMLVERDVLPLADDSFSPTFLRNATAFGASPRMRFDVVLNNLAGLAWTTGKIAMTSDGTPWRPLVHILDIADAIGCVLEAPREAIHGQVFNVGDSRQNYRVREIAQVVAGAFPGCELSFGTNDSDNRSYRVSFEKISAQLPGFRCRRDAQFGAQQLRAVFEQVGMTSAEFESRPYTRLKQLQHLIATKQIDQEFFWRAL
ncbi:SDR family oxidoreductase [Chloroflexia bacterium SDU3-3]|nr:SDR family oxidoreductase [Chloroflexia bacterium SDU3-3]